MTRLILCLLVALAGCGTMPRAVEVPIPVSCHVEVPAEPLWATAGLAADANIFDKVKALLAERVQRIAYEAQLLAAARACQ